MNKIGMFILSITLFLGVGCKCQNFFWSHNCCDNDTVEYLVCDRFSLGFDYANDSLLGYLAIGNLEASGGVIGDYVIDWYLNGDISFSSGTPTSGVSGIIYHPFNGTDSLLTASGDYYPQIRWVEVNDTIFSPSADSTFYAPDLVDCLFPVSYNVDGYNCDNGVVGTYSHSWDYDWEATDNAELSSRNISFYIDNTTDYLPIYFDGDIVADKLEVRYIGDGVDSLLAAIVAGSDNTGTKEVVDTFFWDSSSQYKMILDLTGISYTAGDYIKFVITPSVNNPSELRTIWHLKTICQTDIDFMADCEPIDELQNNVDTSTVYSVYDTANCRFYVYFDPLDISGVDPDFEAYVTYSTSGSAGGSGNSSTSALGADNRFLYANTGIIGGAPSGNVAGDGLCQNLDSAYVTKVDSVLTIVFQDADDYNDWKTNFFLVKADLELTWTSDSTQREYYQGYRIQNYESCADGATVYTYYWHYLSPYSFNDGSNTVEITFRTTTNYYTDIDCSTVYESINTFINNVNSFTTGTITPYYYDGYGGSRRFDAYRVSETPPAYYYQITWSKTIYTYGTRDLCDPLVEFCPVTSSISSYRIGYKIQIHTGFESDPGNNFSLYHLINADGCSTTPCEVYRISGGVVTYPCTQQR